MRAPRSLPATIIYWVVVALLCVAVGEASVRAWGFLPVYAFQAKGIPYTLRFKLDEDLLFQFLPDPEHSINSLGFRDHSLMPKDSAKKRILVVGDSFPAGLFVSPEDTFPKRLEELLPRSEVLNLGVQGYGPDQELLVLRKYGAALTPDAVIWSIFPSNDYNDLIKNRLFVQSSKGELVTSKPNAVGAELPLLRSSMLVRFLLNKRFLPEDAEARLQPLLFVDSEAPAPVGAGTISLMKAVARNFKAEAAALNATLLAVVIPSMEQSQQGASAEHSLNQATVSLLKESGIAVVDLSAVFAGHPEFYTAEEHHLSVVGHQAAAAEIARRENAGSSIE